MDNDLGLVLVRLALGPMILVHGWNKVFGPGGLAGTTQWFGSLGLRPAWLHARIAAASEIGVGLLLISGFLTSVASMVLVGLMGVAALTDHRGKGYFVFKGGCEYTVVVAILGVSLAALGPGEWSVDHLLKLDSAGVGWALGAAGGGSVAAFLVMATCYRPTRERSDAPSGI